MTSRRKLLASRKPSKRHSIAVGLPSSSLVKMRPEAPEPLLHPVFPAVTFPAGTPDSHRRFGCVALQNSYCNSIRKEAPTWAYSPIREKERLEKSEELR